jgi:hypothetical protein
MFARAPKMIGFVLLSGWLAGCTATTPQFNVESLDARVALPKAENFVIKCALTESGPPFDGLRVDVQGTALEKEIVLANGNAQLIVDNATPGRNTGFVKTGDSTFSAEFPAIVFNSQNRLSLVLSFPLSKAGSGDIQMSVHAMDSTGLAATRTFPCTITEGALTMRQQQQELQQTQQQGLGSEYRREMGVRMNGKYGQLINSQYGN